MSEKKDRSGDGVQDERSDANFKLIFQTPEELENSVADPESQRFEYQPRIKFPTAEEGVPQAAEPLRVTSRANSSLRASGRMRSSTFLPTPQRIPPLAQGRTIRVPPVQQQQPTRRRFVPEGTPTHRLTSTQGSESPSDQLKSAANTANEILRAAREEADRIIKDAKRFIEAEKERARENGFQAGKQEASTIVFEAHTARRTLLDAARRDAEELVFAVAEEVIADAITRDRTSIMNRIERAFGYVLNASHITFAVHPDDVDLVRERISDVARNLGFLGECLIRPDEEIAPGSARLETDLCIVEADIESHLDALRDHVSSLLALNVEEEDARRNGRTH